VTWEEAAPLIQRALDRAPPTHTVEDVKAMVAEGRAFFWGWERSVLVALIDDAPLAKTFHQWLVAGDLAELMREREGVEAWAKARGCTRMMTAGRPGWDRVMSKHGYAPAGRVLTKELNG
jgi:hypothetical protein